MKKLYIGVVTLLAINYSVAQTNTSPGMQTPETVNTPTIITNKFGTDYPNTTATWDMDGNNYSAQFMDANTNMGRNVVYDRNGNVMHIDNEMNNTAYPKPIGEYFTKKYPKEEYKVWSSTDNIGNMTYYSKRKTETIWFDKDGMYMSSKPNKKTKK